MREMNFSISSSFQHSPGYGLWSNVRLYPTICLEWLTKTTINMSTWAVSRSKIWNQGFMSGWSNIRSSLRNRQSWGSAWQNWAWVTIIIKIL